MGVVRAKANRLTFAQYISNGFKDRNNLVS